MTFHQCVDKNESKQQPKTREKFERALTNCGTQFNESHVLFLIDDRLL